MSLSLSHIIKVEGGLYLNADLEAEEGMYGYSYDRRRYDQKFILQVKNSKPKKVNRQYVMYAPQDCDWDRFTICYIDNNDKVCWNEKITPMLDENGNHSFNITDYLRSKAVSFTIPEYRRMTYDLMRCMKHAGVDITPYGAFNSFYSGRTGLDGSGDGACYYFKPDYLIWKGTVINSIHIHSYELKPLLTYVDNFLKIQQGEVAQEAFTNLLEQICSGNEIGLKTDRMSLLIQRHYCSGMKLSFDEKSWEQPLPKADIKHSIKPDENMLNKVERYYVSMILQLFSCQTAEEAQKVFEASRTEDILSLK